MREDGGVDPRFMRRLYTFSATARYIGMSPATLAVWTKSGPQRAMAPSDAQREPVVTALEVEKGDRRRIPFIGLIEATVVQAFRQTGLSMQRIRRALQVLERRGELEHALASQRLFTDGAEVLYDYASYSGDQQLRLLTVVHTGQRVFHEVILEYLKRIDFGDDWATGLIIPVTKRRLLRVLPDVAGGDPLFVNGGAPLSAVYSRHRAGEPIASIAADFEVPADDIAESLNAIWPAKGRLIQTYPPFS